MNKTLAPMLARELTFISSQSGNAETDMLRSTKGLKNKKAKEELANAILKATENAKTVEELVYTEMFLQTLDKKEAVTAKDLTGIENAQTAYRQVMETIKQMRRAPAEYFRANLSNPEVGGDFKIMPRIRGLKQIDGNITRLQGRDSFGDEHKRPVWAARIMMAGKTKSMLKTLHDSLATEYERGLKTTERKGKSKK